MCKVDSATSMKICSKCGVEKPATSNYFHRNRAHKSGLHNECKDCRKATTKGYRVRHQEYIRQYQQEWYQRNKDDVIRKSTQYLQLHPDRARKYAQRWRDNHPERAKRLARENYRRHKVNIIARWRERYPTVRDRILAYGKAWRRAKKAERLRRAIWNSGLIKLEFEYFHGYCAVCTKELSKESKPVIWTQSKPDLLVPLCNQCITDKRMSEPEEWLRRCYSIEQTAKIQRIIKDYSIWLESLKRKSA